MKMTKKVLALLIVAAMVVCFTACGNTEKPAAVASDTIRIAYCIPMTGNLKGLGEHYKEGSDHAVAEINENGGILGKKIEAVYIDALDTTQTMTNAIKLALDDPTISCCYVLGYTSTCVAVCPFLEASKMPTLVSGSNEAIIELHDNYIWQHRVLDGYSGVAMANFTAQKLQAKNIAIVYLTNQSCTAQKDVMANALKENGIIVPEENMIAVAEEESNLAPIVAQLKAMNPDCVMLQMTPGPLGLFANAAADGDLECDFIGPATMNQGACLDVAGSNVNGWYTVAEYMPTNDTEANKSFVSGFQARFGHDPDATVVYGYDSTYLFAEAIKLSGDPTNREAINTALGQIKGLELASGTYNAYEDHTYIDRLTIAQIQDGVANYIEMIQYR